MNLDLQSVVAIVAIAVEFVAIAAIVAIVALADEFVIKSWLQSHSPSWDIPDLAQLMTIARRQ